MINSIHGGKYVTINGGTYYSTQTSINMNAPSAGMVRYNGNTRLMEVYDGYSWHSLPSIAPTIDLTTQANSAIDWVIQKMQEEKELQSRMQKYPTLKEAHDHFQTINCLTKEEKHNA
jgi:hypothetical protein